MSHSHFMETDIAFVLSDCPLVSLCVLIEKSLTNVYLQFTFNTYIINDKSYFVKNTSWFKLNILRNWYEDAWFLDLQNSLPLPHTLTCILNIYNEGRLKPNVYDKRNEFNCTIVNFLFLCSNIPQGSCTYPILFSHLIISG